MTDGVPDEFVPDEHIVVGGPAGSCREEIEVVPSADTDGHVVYGICPPFYAPIVVSLGEYSYRVERAGCPSQRVNLKTRSCSCVDRREDPDHWCLHLRAATIIAHQKGGNP